MADFGKYLEEFPLEKSKKVSRKERKVEDAKNRRGRLETHNKGKGVAAAC